MQAEIKVKCRGCGKVVGAVNIDTAELPESLQAKVNGVILPHRSNCQYYGGGRSLVASSVLRGAR